MSEAPGVPIEVLRLRAEREAARRARDFSKADQLRDRIRAAGFDVKDSVDGPVLSPVATAAPSPSSASSEIVNLLDQPATFDASIHWIVEGWPADVVRGMASFDRHHTGFRLQQVVVDLTQATDVDWPPGVDLVHVPVDAGWAAARNAGLCRSLGQIVLIADGSVEAVGDVLSPLAAALEHPATGVTGPFGIVTDDLHEFRRSPGPDVDAVEGYLMALRRELVVNGLRFDPKFRFYRAADIELSFRIKAMGLRATVTPVPLVRHKHRMWANTPDDRRAALSKRNHYRFLERWRGRLDLTVRGRPTGAGEEDSP